MNNIEIEKAIKDCEEKIEAYKNDYKCYVEECNIEMTKLEALKKQSVRKVINRCMTMMMAECPRCNGIVNFPKKYCSWCGQKLDWEE